MLKKFSTKVSAGAKSDSVTEEGEELRVRTTAPREKGKANSAVCSLIAKYFNVSKSAVCIVRGETSNQKLIEVELPD